MKLLLIVNVDWFFLSHRLPIALGAQKYGYQVHLATTFTSSANRILLEKHGIITHDLNIEKKKKNVVSLFRNFCLIVSLIRSIRPDITHLVTLQPILLGGIASRLLGKNNVIYAVSGLGHVFMPSNFFERARCFLVVLAYRFSLGVKNKAIIFQNKSDLEFLSSRCSLSPNMSFLIPGSGVDLSLFSCTPVPPGQITVMMASRLLKTKGVEQFVKAASILKSKGLKANFILVGSPDFSNPSAITKKQLDTWSNQNHIQILGHRDDIHSLMRSSHIVCLPSFYPEGLPKVLCEAASCGRVVVTSDHPGCRDAILDGVTGVLVPPRDPYALSSALEQLILAPSKIQRMGIAARRYAEEMFDIDQIVKQHLDIYSLLHSNQS